MTMPLFLVAEPVALTGLILIAMAACLVLDEGRFNRKTPGILVGLRAKSPDSKTYKFALNRHGDRLQPHNHMS